MNTGARDDGALPDLAQAMGILPHWCDLAGVEQATGPDTERALLAAMGVPAVSEAETREWLADLQVRRAARSIPEEIVVAAGAGIEGRIPLERTADWQLELESGGTQEGRSDQANALKLPVGLHRLTVGDEVCLVIAAPERAPAVGDVTGRSRAWGLSVALHGLRSRRNLGVGDYRDLAEAAEQVARLGADFIGINPVHARGTASDVFSPYSPTCRTALEPGYIAPDAVPGFESCADVRRLLTECAADLEAEKSGGQTWNLAPFNPPGLRAAAYQPFVQMLRAAMAHAGIIRIDHVLGLNRSFWIPDSGAPGGFVSYPLGPLLALVRIEAARAGCIVVGEDLGSVPRGLPRRLADAGLLGCAVMQFEKDEHPNWRRRYPVAAEALASAPGLAAIATVIGSRGDSVSSGKPGCKELRQWA